MSPSGGDAGHQPPGTADPLGEQGWSLPGRLAAMILGQMTEPVGSLEDS
jgi:hypothetical protein